MLTFSKDSNITYNTKHLELCNEFEWPTGIFLNVPAIANDHADMRPINTHNYMKYRRKCLPPWMAWIGERRWRNCDSGAGPDLVRTNFWSVGGCARAICL